MECDPAVTAAGVAREAVVRQYFEDHNVKDILEQLLKELGEGMPLDPYRCIGDWAYRQSAAAAQQRGVSSGGSSGGSGGQHGAGKETITPTDVPVSLPSSVIGSRTQSAHRLSQSSSIRRPRRWNALLLGPEAARTEFFTALIDVSMEPSEAVEEHSRRVRELVRPFFPGKQTIRMVAHELPCIIGSSGGNNCADEPSSVVFIDPKITSTTTEKSLFAMSVADVIVYCGERHTVPSVVGSDSIEKYLVAAWREGVRGAMAWCPDGGNLVSTASKLTLPSDGVAGGRAAVVFAIPSPPTKDALLQTMVDLPLDFLRPQHERQSAPVASTADFTAPALLPCTTTLVMECNIECLEGESIRVGDALAVHCCGRRLEATVATIDLVYSNRLPSNVLRRDCDAASGAEGAIVTVTVAPSDTVVPIVSSVGLPVLTFVRTDEISEAVVAIIKAQLLSVHEGGSASPPFSSDEEDFEF